MLLYLLYFGCILLHLSHSCGICCNAGIGCSIFVVFWYISCFVFLYFVVFDVWLWCVCAILCNNICCISVAFWVTFVVLYFCCVVCLMYYDCWIVGCILFSVICCCIYCAIIVVLCDTFVVSLLYFCCNFVVLCSYIFVVYVLLHMLCFV